MDASTGKEAGGQERPRHPLLRGLLLSLRALGGWLIAFASIAAGLGILYLLRSVSALAHGPHIAGALPLQQLAGGERQPLLRMALAWLPAGLVGGFALAFLTRLGAITRTALFASLAAVLLLVAGAVSDAAAISDPVGPHLTPQLGRTGTWVAVALLAAGASTAAWLTARASAAGSLRSDGRPSAGLAGEAARGTG